MRYLVTGPQYLFKILPEVSKWSKIPDYEIIPNGTGPAKMVLSDLSDYQRFLVLQLFYKKNQKDNAYSIEKLENKIIIEGPLCMELLSILYFSKGDIAFSIAPDSQQLVGYLKTQIKNRTLDSQIYPLLSKNLSFRTSETHTKVLVRRVLPLLKLSIPFLGFDYGVHLASPLNKKKVSEVGYYTSREISKVVQREVLLIRYDPSSYYHLVALKTILLRIGVPSEEISNAVSNSKKSFKRPFYSEYRLIL